jgi:hypothetical protein
LPETGWLREFASSPAVENICRENKGVRGLVIARSGATKQSISPIVEVWIASRSTSPGAHSRDPNNLPKCRGFPIDARCALIDTRSGMVPALARVEALALQFNQYAAAITVTQNKHFGEKAS